MYSTNAQGESIRPVPVGALSLLSLSPKNVEEKHLDYRFCNTLCSMHVSKLSSKAAALGQSFNHLFVTTGKRSTVKARFHASEVGVGLRYSVTINVGLG